VFNVKERKVVGVIPDTKGVHGIALARELGKGFVSNGRDSSVTVFDMKSLATIKKIRVTGQNPDAILYDPFTKRVFTWNGRSANATVIDAASEKVIGTIPLSGKPEFSVSDGKGRVFVNIEDKSLVCLINPKTMTIEKTWPVAPGEEPSGLAMDRVENRLFIVCANKLMIILDAESGKMIGKVEIGDRVDGVAYDPALKRIYSSNGEGTMTIIQEENKNSFRILENFPTQPGARTITLDPKTHRLYLPVAEYQPSSPENPRARPAIRPGTFTVLEIGQE
jgi:DNA-binding beta-propeller fold protein YncE